MDHATFQIFISRAEDMWEKMERYRQAYAQSSDQHAHRATILKWLTVVFGAITGVSSGTTMVGEGSPSAVLVSIAGVAGIVTGALSISDRLFQWEANSKDYWLRSKELDDLQTSLYQSALSVTSSLSSEDPAFYLERTNQKLAELTSLRVSGLDRYAQTAKDATNRRGFQAINFNPPAAPEAISEDGPADDSATILAVPSRRRA